jgi:hypothetical protein
VKKKSKIKTARLNSYLQKRIIQEIEKYNKTREKEREQ